MFCLLLSIVVIKTKKYKQQLTFLKLLTIDPADDDDDDKA